MGDRQKHDRGVLKEGFLGKAKFNVVSQLFSKKGKVSCTERYLHDHSISDVMCQSVRIQLQSCSDTKPEANWLPQVALSQ